MAEQSSTDKQQAWLPVLSLKNTVLFPSLLLPLSVGRPGSQNSVQAAVDSEDKSLLLVAQKDLQVEEPTFDDLYAVGTLGVIKRLERTPGGIQLVVQGVERFRITETGAREPYLQARGQVIPQPTDESTELEALHGAILELGARIQGLVGAQTEVSIPQIIQQVPDWLHQVYLLASMLGLEAAKEQALLEAPTRLEALRLMHDYLVHEVQVLELRQKITSQAATEMSREQREYLLRRQMEAIREELGETTPEQAEVVELRKRLDESDLPEEVRKELDRELGRLEKLPTAAPDYQMTRGYIEFVLELPWSQVTEDVLDLDRARQILDDDHYDLAEIKDRLIEHLAVLKLNPSAKAPILCFVGPPGVGKTSLGQSMARALGRKFERMSLGGLHDEAELRGHRRTYIGAMPGRILQAIRRAGVRNPLLMLDEVDKLGHDFRGDPAAALLEILDPAQNVEFRDNYLNLPFDLSKVFFVTTANTLDTIPRPLIDRMEVVRLSGYSEEEKLQIARRYLIPRQLREAGIDAERFTLPDETIRRVISTYTREAGVRQLERAIGQLARKVAVRYARGETTAITVRPEDLSDMMGRERFHEDRAREVLPPGVATGLAWTETGGEVLYVEAVLLPDGKDLTLTGQLGTVMKESAQAARSFVWAQAESLGISPELLRSSGVHIHVPAGAIPKDGPSAGVAMASAIVSAFTRLPTRMDTAMTGEITLSGLVLPIGGLKEKVLAARRAGIKRVVLPKDNEQDLKELPDDVRAAMEFLPVSRIEDALHQTIAELSDQFAPASG